MNEKPTRHRILFAAAALTLVFLLGVGFILFRTGLSSKGENSPGSSSGTLIFDLQDLDGDRLPNRYEVNTLIPFALPVLPDTDLDGVPDGEEDLDGDGLANLGEMEFGSDPLTADSDGDGLIDGDESYQGTDPRQGDTDRDGLSDDSEVFLGTDPTHEDTDGDGKADGNEVHRQTLESSEHHVTVDLLGRGDHREGFRAHSLSGVSLFEDTPGLVGDFIDLETELPMESAVIHLSYQGEKVPESKEQDLRLLLYDGQNYSFQLLSDQRVDVSRDVVAGRTDILGPVGIIYLPEWESTWDAGSGSE